MRTLIEKLILLSLKFKILKFFVFPIFYFWMVLKLLKYIFKKKFKPVYNFYNFLINLFFRKHRITKTYNSYQKYRFFYYLSGNFLFFFIVHSIFKVYRFFICKRLTSIYLKKYKKRKFKNKIETIPHKEKVYDLSIAMPCYIRSKNVLYYFEKALDGIYNSLKKTNLSFEVCIFDNASNQDLSDLLERYKLKLNINYFKQDKLLQPNFSWTNAVKLTKGKYVHLHSCDDLIDINFYNKFEKQILNQSCDVIYVTAKNLYLEDFENAYFDWKYNWPSTKSTFFDPKYKFIRHPMPSSSWICKRTFYETYGVINYWIDGLDLDLAFRLETFSKKTYFSKESFLYYRTHPDMGNVLDNPKDFKEFVWNITKVRFLNFYYDVNTKLGFKKIEDYIYNYYKFYFFTHGMNNKIKDMYRSSSNNNDPMREENKRKLNKILNTLFGKKKYYLKIFFLKLNRYIQDKRILPNSRLNFLHFNQVVFFNPFCLPYFFSKKLILKIYYQFL